jgi:putative heme-binding domain-containing protein
VIFRAQCATCHGPDAKGIASIDAPDLTLMWSNRELADIDVFTTIRNGIPGSIMPAHDFPGPQVWMLVAYLRSIAVSGTSRTLTGDAGVGRELFAANCATCHRVAGKGGSLGPDLTRIMTRRSVTALVESIRNPDVEIGSRYRPVLITAVDGQRLQGTIKSEDAFSLQVMDMNQQLRGVTKDSIQSIQRPTQSLMPRFDSNVLGDDDIENILTYLQVQQ